MSKNQKIFFFIDCYGAWAPELRRPIETIGYDQYLNSVVKAIVSLSSRIEDIYISGGMFDSLNRTECETTKPELEKRLREYGLNFSIKSDEDSFTTIENMKTFLETWQNKFSHTIPVITVDTVRYETNCYIFEYFCQKLNIQGLKAREVIIPFPRLDDHPDSTYETQQEKIMLIKEKGVDYVLKLQQELRKDHILKNKELKEAEWNKRS